MSTIEESISILCSREYPYTNVLVATSTTTANNRTHTELVLHKLSTFLSRASPTPQQASFKPTLSFISSEDHVAINSDPNNTYQTYKTIEQFIKALTKDERTEEKERQQLLEGLSSKKTNSIKPANGLEECSWIANAIDKCYHHLPPQPSIEAEEIALVGEEEYLCWNFYPPSDQKKLLSITLSIFERNNLLDDLEVDKECFRRFIRVIQWNYMDNPYHNFSHAVDVLQAAAYVLHQIGCSGCGDFDGCSGCYNDNGSGINTNDKTKEKENKKSENQTGATNQKISKLDQFSLLIAALCHDVRHGAFNNVFQENNDTLLALLYNDKAPMESLHSMATFSIIRCPLYNFVKHWQRPKYKEFRSLVIDCILGTDMKVHFDFINKFKTSLFPSDDCLIKRMDLSSRSLLLVSLIKFCDISNVIRPFAISKRWGFHLMKEFYHQGDWEHILGLPQSPLTQRGSQSSLAEGQILFITKIALPLYTVMASGFKGSLDWSLKLLMGNVESWKEWKGEDGLTLRFT